MFLGTWGTALSIPYPHLAGICKCRSKTHSTWPVLALAAELRVWLFLGFALQHTWTSVLSTCDGTQLEEVVPIRPHLCIVLLARDTELQLFCFFFNSDKEVMFLLFVGLPVRRITRIILKHGGDEAWAKDEPVKFCDEVGNFHPAFTCFPLLKKKILFHV